MDSLKLLIVDDEAGMLMAIDRVLKNHIVQIQDPPGKYKFLTQMAESGEEALSLIRQETPDILLLDQKLPGISGLDLMKHLHESGINIVTIMITAYASIETAVIATKMGGHDFLAKPFSPEELKACLYRAVKVCHLIRHTQKLEAEKRRHRFDFISIVAHELKAPLAAIENYLNIINERHENIDPVLYGKMIERSLLRLKGMRKLILDLLDLTRIESGINHRLIESLDVVVLVQTAIDTVMSEATLRHVEIRFEAPECLKMNGNERELMMVACNLISNAVKYNRENGLVDIRLKAQAENIFLTVRDSGIGMSQDEISRLGEEFVRIKNDRTEDIPGSGLGLSIVKKIVQLYDGKMTIKSAPDVGSEFSVFLRNPKLP